MPETIRRPVADALRTSVFRDLARDVVWKDRAERKAGRSVDTAGAIARALEQAYRLGFEEAQTGQPMRMEAPLGAPMVWDLIPRRPRKALWGICFRILGDGRRPELVGWLSRAKLERGGPGWRLDAVGKLGDPSDIYADRDVVVLVRHELLGTDTGQPDRLVLTSRGRATWRIALDAVSEPIFLSV